MFLKVYCIYNAAIITPCACTRGKAIGFVCRHLSSSSVIISTKIVRSWYLGIRATQWISRILPKKRLASKVARRGDNLADSWGLILIIILNFHMISCFHSNVHVHAYVCCTHSAPWHMHTPCTHYPPQASIGYHGHAPWLNYIVELSRIDFTIITVLNG